MDNFLNYLIYLFIIYFGFKIQPRKNKIFRWLSVVVVFAAGIFNMYFETNSPIVYVCWSVFFATPKYLKMQNAFPKVAAGNSSFLHVSPA